MKILLLRALFSSSLVTLITLVTTQSSYGDCHGFPYAEDSPYCLAINDYIAHPQCGLSEVQITARHGLNFRESLCLAISGLRGSVPCYLNFNEVEAKKVCESIRDGYHGEVCRNRSDHSPDGESESALSIIYEDPFHLCMLGAHLTLHPFLGGVKNPLLVEGSAGPRILTAGKKAKMASTLRSVIIEQVRERPWISQWRFKLQLDEKTALEMIDSIESARTESFHKSFQLICVDSEAFCYQPHILRLAFKSQSPSFVPIELKVVLFKNGQTVIYFPQIIIGKGTFKSVYLGMDYDKVFEGLPSTAVAVAEGHLGAPGTPKLEVNRISIKLDLENHRWLSQKFRQGTTIESTALIRRKNAEYYLTVGPLYDFDLLQYSQFRSEGSGSNGLLIAKDILDGLVTLQGLGFAHRDIKLNNLLVSNSLQDGDVESKILLSDFGSALHRDGMATDGYVPSCDYTTYEYYDPGLSDLATRARELSLPAGMDIDLPREAEPALFVSHQDLQMADVWSAGMTLYQTLIRPSSNGCPLLTKEWHASHVIGEFTDSSQLCRYCSAFCDPKNKPGEFNVLIPVEGTLESVIYQMVHPDPQKRITATDALKQVLAII